MSGERVYRLSWEAVAQSVLHLYCNANPVFYSNVTQAVPNSQIPDEHWHRIERIDTNPWQQYNQLRKWADADEEFIRNVTLEQAASIEPDWQPVP